MEKKSITKKTERKRKNKMIRKLCKLKITDPKMSNMNYLIELDLKTIEQQNKLVLEFASKIKSSKIKEILDKYKKEIFYHPTSFILKILKELCSYENIPENANYVNWLANDLITEAIFKQRFEDDYFSARLNCYIIGYNNILMLSRQNYINGFLLDW